MQLDWFFGLRRRGQPAEDWLKVGPRQLPLLFVRNGRARRYVLRLKARGIVRVTVPRGGSLAEAKRFAERNTAWLERQLLRQATAPATSAGWSVGTEIYFRGQLTRLEAGEPGLVNLGAERILVADLSGDLQPAVERHLRNLATREMPPLVLEFAARHQLEVRRVTVRGQKTRWGSCSRRGHISLNWRLVQTPQSVRDYIILHELAHLRHMNHSRRYWAEVARLCPEFESAEKWLKTHARLLG